VLFSPWSLHANAEPDIPGRGPEAALREGLLVLYPKLVGFQWQRQDGASMWVMKVPVDKGWMPDVVEQSIRASGRERSSFQ